MTTVSAILKSDKNYTTEIDASGHQLIADEPIDHGGDDKGPNPYALVASGLAACTLITLKMYARRKDWGLGDLLVDVSHNKDYHAEYTDCEKSSIKKDIFTRKVKISADISEAKLKRLIYIADRCPVHRTLEETSIIKTEFV
tara:strand:+ start:624 stop:1049 length:426 start_codon:yes stop_codon:yes gene_type:complete